MGSLLGLLFGLIITAYNSRNEKADFATNKKDGVAVTDKSWVRIPYMAKFTLKVLKTASWSQSHRTKVERIGTKQKMCSHVATTVTSLQPNHALRAEPASSVVLTWFDDFGFCHLDSLHRPKLRLPPTPSSESNLKIFEI